MPKKTNFFAAILHPFWAKVFESETTSFHYFSPRFWNFFKFGHWTLGSGGKKTFKMSEQMKISVRNYFLPLQLKTLYEQKVSNLTPNLSSTFLQGFQKSKKFGHWTSGHGHGHTDTRTTYRKHRPGGPMLWRRRRKKYIYICGRQ